MTELRSIVPGHQQPSHVHDDFRPGQRYDRWCLPDVQRRADLLESLRVKWRYHADRDTRVMRVLNAIGRSWIGWLVGLYLGYRLGLFW